MFLTYDDEEAAFPTSGKNPSKLGEKMVQPRPRVVPLKKPLIHGQPFAEVDLRDGIYVVDTVLPKPVKDMTHRKLLFMGVLVLIHEPDHFLLLVPRLSSHVEIKPCEPIPHEAKDQSSQVEQEPAVPVVEADDDIPSFFHEAAEVSKASVRIRGMVKDSITKDILEAVIFQSQVK